MGNNSILIVEEKNINWWFIYFNFVQFLKFDFFIKINKFINILIYILENIIFFIDITLNNF